MQRAGISEQDWAQASCSGVHQPRPRPHQSRDRHRRGRGRGRRSRDSSSSSSRSTTNSSSNNNNNNNNNNNVGVNVVGVGGPVGVSSSGEDDEASDISRRIAKQQEESRRLQLDRSCHEDEVEYPEEDISFAWEEANADKQHVLLRLMAMTGTKIAITVLVVLLFFGVIVAILVTTQGIAKTPEKTRKDFLMGKDTMPRGRGHEARVRAREEDDDDDMREIAAAAAAASSRTACTDQPPPADSACVGREWNPPSMDEGTVVLYHCLAGVSRIVKVSVCKPGTHRWITVYDISRTCHCIQR